MQKFKESAFIVFYFIDYHYNASDTKNFLVLKLYSFQKGSVKFLHLQSPKMSVKKVLIKKLQLTRMNS